MLYGGQKSDQKGATHFLNGPLTNTLLDTFNERYTTFKLFN